MISSFLKEAKFIAVQPNSKHPLIEKDQDWNNYTLDWESSNKILEQGNNIGLVCGINGFICIDCDDLRLTQACEQLLPPTYTEQTPSGGTHLIYRLQGDSYENFGINYQGGHLGELRCNRQYVVIAPSKAPSKLDKQVKHYTCNDLSVAEVIPEQIKELLKQFDVPETPQSKLSTEIITQLRSDSKVWSLFNGETSAYASRSEAEQALVDMLVSRDFDKAQVFQVMASCEIGKWKESRLSYRELTYQKAVTKVTQEKQGWKDGKNQNIPRGIECWGLRDYENYKEKKTYIIDGVLYPGITMKYGQSGCFKSLETLYEAMCIASGKEFLGAFRVKKQVVGILSAENSKLTDKIRLKSIRRGLGIRNMNIPLYIIPRSSCSDVLNLEYFAKLRQVILDKGIKVLFVDTINPVTPDIDDNKAADVVGVFNNFLKILADDGISVIFLHHTDKQGSSFLGSTKWKGNSDCVTRIERKDLEHSLKLFNEKNREGESHTIEIGLTFEEEKIMFRLLQVSDPEIFKLRKESKNKAEALREQVLKILDSPKSRQEIIKCLSASKIHYSVSTLDNQVLKVLIDCGTITNAMGKYYVNKLEAKPIIK